MAEEAGFVHAIDAREVGLAVVELGGGRRKKGDAIDFGVGVVCQAKVGDRVAVGDPICTVHAGDGSSAQAAIERLRAAWRVEESEATPLPVVLDRVTGG